MKKITTVLLSSLLGGLIAVSIFKFTEYPAQNKWIDQQAIPAQPVKYAVNTNVDFSETALKVTPAVVHIKSKLNASTGNDRMRSPLEDFFGDRFGLRNAPLEAAGSGVIISEDGYIVTNNHVIEDAEQIEITLYDKRSFKAQLVGRDPSTDLALLKIEALNLPYLIFGNADEVMVGQWVLAVGNPFNLASTVTAGIVSAKGRNINLLREKSAVPIESFIQTDAVVNRGNSGGALVNTNGELIGINTAIASQTGYFTGYSFAVPSSIVNKVVVDLKSYGSVQRAYLGVQIADINSELAERNGLSITKGVYIAKVQDGGAAENAGMQEGDIILEIDQKEVSSVPELQEIIATHQPDDVVRVKVRRKSGEERYVNVKLKNAMGNAAVLSRNNGGEMIEKLGADFSELTVDVLSKYNIEEGIEITRVYRNGKLHQANVAEGFIITKVNKKKVRSVNELKDILENSTDFVTIEGFYKNQPSGFYSYSFGLR